MENFLALTWKVLLCWSKYHIDRPVCSRPLHHKPRMLPTSHCKIRRNLIALPTIQQDWRKPCQVSNIYFLSSRQQLLKVCQCSMPFILLSIPSCRPLSLALLHLPLSAFAPLYPPLVAPSASFRAVSQSLPGQPEDPLPSRRHAVLREPPHKEPVAQAGNRRPGRSTGHF
jgi:hypothetical protein